MSLYVLLTTFTDRDGAGQNVSQLDAAEIFSLNILSGHIFMSVNNIAGFF